MKTLLLAALAPLALLASPAAAQTTTMQRTVSTPAGSVTTTRTTDRMAPAHRTTVVRTTSAPTTVVRTTHVRRTVTHRARVLRQCSTRWSHHRRVRVCRTVRIH